MHRTPLPTQKWELEDSRALITASTKNPMTSEWHASQSHRCFISHKGVMKSFHRGLGDRKPTTNTHRRSTCVNTCTNFTHETLYASEYIDVRTQICIVSEKVDTWASTWSKEREYDLIWKMQWNYEGYQIGICQSQLLPLPNSVQTIQSSRTQLD